MLKLKFNPVTGAFDLVDEAQGTLPAGGTTGQVLVKSSNSDYSAQWATPSSGGSSGLQDTFLLMGA